MWDLGFVCVRGFPLYPNISNFGAAKRPNIKGQRESEGLGSNLASSPQIIYVCGFFSLPTRPGEMLLLGCFGGNFRNFGVNPQSHMSWFLLFVFGIPGSVGPLASHKT